MDVRARPGAAAAARGRGAARPQDDWPRLYDQDRLRANEVPAAAAVYYDDMYVPLQFSVETAATIRGLRHWVTNEYEHDGLRVSGGAVLDRLIGMVRGHRLAAARTLGPVTTGPAWALITRTCQCREQARASRPSGPRGTARIQEVGLRAGRWVGLGGHVEDGEEFAEQRPGEVAEESGLIVPADPRSTCEHRNFMFPARPPGIRSPRSS